MSKRHSPPGIRVPTLIPQIFMIDEVFVWVCDKQCISPDHLTDARWRSLHYIAEQTTQKLNALFAAEKVKA